MEATAKKGGVVPYAQAFESLLALLAPFGTADLPARPVRLSSEYLRNATDEILAANDLADLEDRIDVLTMDDRYWEEWSRIHQDRPQPRTIEELRAALTAGAKVHSSSLAAVLGPTASNRYEKGREAFAEAGRRLWTLAENPPRGFPKVDLTPKPRDKASPKLLSSALYDSKMPLVFRRALAAFASMSIAHAAILRAEERGQRLEPWLALALAETYARVPESMLAAFEPIPETLEDLLAKALAFAVLIGEGMAGEKALKSALERWRREAEESGEGIYFPFGRPDADAG